MEDKEAKWTDGIIKQMEDKKPFKSVKDMNQRELVDTYNRIQKSMAKLMGQKVYHKQTYNGIFELTKL